MGADAVGHLVLGAVPVLGNRWWSAPEAAHCLATVAPRAVLTDAPI